MSKWQSYPESVTHPHNLTFGSDVESYGPPSSIAGLHKANRSADSLGVRVKELIALAMAVASGDGHRIYCHVESARRTGATHREIIDTVALAVLVGGEELVVAGDQARKALEQYEAMPFYRELAETVRARRAVGSTPPTSR